MKRKRFPTRADYFWSAWSVIVSAAMEGLAGMRKYYPKALKRHKPVRVIDPQGSHTVRVHPRQGIKLVLCQPQTLSNVDANGKYEITFNNDFLYLEKTEHNNKNQIVYYIGQKYDLTSWAELTETFLGEVRVDIVDNTHENRDDCKYEGATLGVYHCPQTQNAGDVITVVNPETCTVKLEPSRVLEVVCYEPSWPEDCCETWKVHVEDFEVEAQGIFVQNINKHNILTRLYADDKGSAGGFTVKPRHNPTVNGLLEEKMRSHFQGELERRKTPGRENHFWFAFTADSKKKIASLKNGSYICARITLIGAAKIDGEWHTVKRELILMLSKHGKPVASSKMFNHSRALMAIKDDKPIALRRHQDKNRCLLQNPGNTESLDFSTGYEDCAIEVPFPKSLWPEEPADAEWLVAYDDGVHGDKYLSLIKLDPVERDGYRFQKFRIERKQGVAAPTETNGCGNFLGAIKISYPPKKNFTESSKRIAVWLQEKRKQYKSAYHCGNVTGPHHWKQGLGYYSESNLKVAIVKIEEIPIKSLEDKAHTVKLHAHSYYSDYDNAYYGVPIKKKGSIPASHVMGNRPTNEASAGRTGYRNTPTSTGDTTRTGTTTEGELSTSEPIILYNPAHLQEVTLAPEQELILRLSQPDELLLKQEEREKCRGELWTLNPMAVCDTKPLVYQHRVVEVATGRYKQEARIRADVSRLPAVAGTHNAGAVRLECSATCRVIRIHVKKGQTEQKQQRLLHQIKFLEKLPYHEAAGKKYVFANNWKHGDGVRITPKDVVYVKTPEIPEDYDGNWNVQFLQHAIPNHVWERLPNNIREKVNRQHPWYAKDVPVIVRDTLVFKPLQESASGMLPELLDALKASGLNDYLPVLTLVYENFRIVTEESQIGLVEVRKKLVRELTLCVNLKSAPAQPRYVWHPTDGMEMKANKGDILSINFTPTDEKQIPNWKCTEHPTFIKYEGTNVAQGNEQIKLYVQGRGSGIIKFKTKEKILSIYVNVA